MSSEKLPTLRLSGYSSVAWLKDVFGSYLVDVAYVAEFGNGYALVRPDDTEHTNLEVEADRQWLAGVILDTMKTLGENNVLVSYLPRAP